MTRQQPTASEPPHPKQVVADILWRQFDADTSAIHHAVDMIFAALGIEPVEIVQQVAHYEQFGKSSEFDEYIHSHMATHLGRFLLKEEVAPVTTTTNGRQCCDVKKMRCWVLRTPGGIANG